MLKSLTKAPSIILRIKSKIKLPEKCKGTIIEKWTNYWKNLFIDYRQMLHDLRTDIQDDPRRAMRWTAGIATLYGLALNNPDELDFKDNLKRINNEAVVISEDCLNQETAEHLWFLDTCYNQGIIHYRSLGILSIMYLTDMNDACDLYKAHCSYIQPSYLSFASRIIDVGIVGKWWNLFIKTHNYDVKRD